MKDTREAGGLLVDPPLAPRHGAETGASELLWFIVQRLCETSSVAMARIWLLRPGQGCPTCPMRAECPSQTRCLHLVASAGTSVACPGCPFSNRWRLSPLPHWGFARLADRSPRPGRGGTPDLASLPDWIVSPAWVQAEGIKGLGSAARIPRERAGRAGWVLVAKPLMRQVLTGCE